MATVETSASMESPQESTGFHLDRNVHGKDCIRGELMLTEAEFTKFMEKVQAKTRGEFQLVKVPPQMRMGRVKTDPAVAESYGILEPGFTTAVAVGKLKRRAQKTREGMGASFASDIAGEGGMSRAAAAKAAAAAAVGSGGGIPSLHPQAPVVREPEEEGPDMDLLDHRDEDEEEEEAPLQVPVKRVHHNPPAASFPSHHHQPRGHPYGDMNAHLEHVQVPLKAGASKKGAKSEAMPSLAVSKNRARASTGGGGGLTTSFAFGVGVGGVGGAAGARMDTSVYEKCKNILQELASLDENGYCRETSKQLEWVGFTDVVKKPISFGDITKKLVRSEYASPAAFASDMRRIFYNFFLYHGRDQQTGHREYAFWLAHEFEKRYDENGLNDVPEPRAPAPPAFNHRGAAALKANGPSVPVALHPSAPPMPSSRQQPGGFKTSAPAARAQRRVGGGGGGGAQGRYASKARATHTGGQATGNHVGGRGQVFAEDFMSAGGGASRAAATSRAPLGVDDGPEDQAEIGGLEDDDVMMLASQPPAQSAPPRSGVAGGKRKAPGGAVKGGGGSRGGRTAGLQKGRKGSSGMKSLDLGGQSTALQMSKAEEDEAFDIVRYELTLTSIMEIDDWVREKAPDCEPFAHSSTGYLGDDLPQPQWRWGIDLTNADSRALYEKIHELKQRDIAEGTLVNRRLTHQGGAASSSQANGAAGTPNAGNAGEGSSWFNAPPPNSGHAGRDRARGGYTSESSSSSGSSSGSSSDSSSDDSSDSEGEGGGRRGRLRKSSNKKRKASASARASADPSQQGQRPPGAPGDPQGGGEGGGFGSSITQQKRPRFLEPPAPSAGGPSAAASSSSSSPGGLIDHRGPLGLHGGPGPSSSGDPQQNLMGLGVGSPSAAESDAFGVGGVGVSSPSVPAALSPSGPAPRTSGGELLFDGAPNGPGGIDGGGLHGVPPLHGGIGGDVSGGGGDAVDPPGFGDEPGPVGLHGGPGGGPEQEWPDFGDMGYFGGGGDGDGDDDDMP